MTAGATGGPTDSRGHVQSRDGTRIALYRSGAGRPLVLVHGTAADHTAFRVVGPMFAGRHAVVAIDRRGRGASGDSPPYAIEREYEDVVAVVDAIAREAGQLVDVVGHSFGGRCALGAAPLTTNLRRLVVYESAPAPAGLTFEPPDLLVRLRALEAAGDWPGLLRTFMGEVAGMTEEELDAYEANPIWPRRVAAAHTILRELTAGGAEGDPAATARLAAAVRVPVLQLLGGESRPIFRLGTEALDDALTDGRIVVLPGQRHAAHHAAPDRFVAEVEHFLEADA
jgi:pimeloyl-ACP methyl ester carboxylesterase